MPRSGKAKARIKRHRADPKTKTDCSWHDMTMQQEARNTEGRNLWRTGLALRHKSVQFVSADGMPLEQKTPQEDSKPDEKSSDQNDTCVHEQRKDLDTMEHKLSLVDMLDEHIANTENSGSITSDDTHASIQGPSDGESSEDVIVFNGRHNRQEHEKPNSDAPRAKIHGPLQVAPKIAASKFSNQPLEYTAVPDRSPPRSSHILDAPFISLESPQRCKGTRSHQQFDDIDILADYIANMDSDYHEDQESHSPSEEELDAEAGIEGPLDTARPSNIPTGHHRLPHKSQQESAHLLSVRPSFIQGLEGADEVSSIVNAGGDPDACTSDPRGSPWSSTDSSDTETEEDAVLVDSFSHEIDSILRELEGYTTHPSRSCRRKRGGGLTTATAFADALELDPYYGFDVMDFERPSLRKQKKGKNHSFNITLSDTELETQLQTAWRTDRDKKKNRKQKREELRSQGLLGRNAGYAETKTSYSASFDLQDMNLEIRNFMLSPKNSLSLPPMDKHRRKVVHDMANELSLNSKSRGKGSSRFPILIKTSRTPQHTHKTITQVDRVLSKFKFKKMVSKSWGKSIPKGTKPRRGRPDGAVSYIDGDIVGGSAPEIGVGNKGRAMLEKMGWSTGTALGAANNKGILLPVAHVVKNSKAGLG